MFILIAAMPINLLKINSIIVFLFLNIDCYEDPILILIHRGLLGSHKKSNWGLEIIIHTSGGLGVLSIEL